MANKKLTINDHIITGLSFVTSLVFVIFVIKPGVGTLFALQAQKKALQQTNEVYKGYLTDVNVLMQKEAKNIEAFKLYNKVIPDRPLLSNITQDEIAIASQSALTIYDSSIGETSLKNTDSSLQLKKVELTLSMNGSFESLLSYIDTIHEQKRIKNFNSITITKEVSNKNSTSSGKLDINAIISSFFL